MHHGHAGVTAAAGAPSAGTGAAGWASTDLGTVAVQGLYQASDSETVDAAKQLAPCAAALAATTQQPLVAASNNLTSAGAVFAAVESGLLPRILDYDLPSARPSCTMAF